LWSDVAIRSAVNTPQQPKKGTIDYEKEKKWGNPSLKALRRFCRHPEGERRRGQRKFHGFFIILFLDFQHFSTTIPVVISEKGGKIRPMRRVSMKAGIGRVLGN